jgi:AcrR family transcriptional regulator
MDKVAKTGGVSKATVYSYFPDKEGLFAALVQRLAREKVYPRSRIPKCDRQNLGSLWDNYSGSQESEVWGRVLYLCPMPYALCPMSTSCY